MAKDTYKNELDRLLAPFIEAVAAISPKAPDPHWESDDPSDEAPMAAIFRFGDGHCFELVVSEYSTVIYDGLETLYWRDECCTNIFRPGVWVNQFIRAAELPYMGSLKDRIDSALDAAISVGGSFAPV